MTDHHRIIRPRVVNGDMLANTHVPGGEMPTREGEEKLTPKKSRLTWDLVFVFVCLFLAVMACCSFSGDLAVWLAGG